MAFKNRKHSESDADEIKVKNKAAKRKISRENGSIDEKTLNNSENLIHDDGDGAGDIMGDDFLRTIPNDSDSSDNDNSEGEEEEEAESYDNSDSDSDGGGFEDESPDLSFEESDSDGDPDYNQSRSDVSKKELSTASTSKREQSQFEMFTKSLLKSLNEKGSSSESAKEKNSKMHNMVHRNDTGKVIKESGGMKGPSFTEVVLERMKKSQEKGKENENDNKDDKLQKADKPVKLSKRDVHSLINEYLTKSNAERNAEEQERYLTELIKDTEYHKSEEEEEDGDDGEEKDSEDEKSEKSSDDKDALEEDQLLSEDEDDDDTSDEELGKKSAQVGLKRDLEVKGTHDGEATQNEASAAKQPGVGEPYDEYEYDTSDEEDVRNTVGNIPLSWYENHKHVGYTRDGKKILQPPSQDEIDKFLKKMEDPLFGRTVKDPQTGHDVVLTESDAKFIKRLRDSNIPDSDFQAYSPWIDWFSSEVLQMPLRKFPEHKRSFICSQTEARRVRKLAERIQKGWIKPEEKKSNEPKFYNLWEADNIAEHMRRIYNHIPAPKRNLPNHAESYNPPSEYLFDTREMKEWSKLKHTPSKRKLHFIPQKYKSLREVPAYDRYMQERFFRCLDLYLCPRERKMKLLIEPEDLLPKLPSPKDLQPFPTTQSLIYKGHADMVRTITVEPKGQYLASGSDDMTVKIWEVSTGRCVRTIPAGGIVRSVSWCPNAALSLLAVAADRKLLLINPDVGDKLIVKKTDSLLEEHPENDVLVPVRVKNAVQWEQAAGDEWKKGVRIIINHFKEIKQVTWHGRGDYFSTVMSDAQNRSVLIHQISKRRSQIPFNKSKGLIQCVLFHPIKPIFFVASQKNIRVYDLMKQEMIKKLLSNAKWISTMAVHPGGDNLLVATYDRKILWFDLDLSTSPYQTLRMHSCAVRGVAYHKRYPLFASCSDDESVIVSHGMVFHNDLLKNALIVPLKRLTYHEKQNDFSSFDVVFHPSQPWLFSSGADGTVRLYT